MRRKVDNPYETQPIIVHASNVPFYLRRFLVALLLLIILVAGLLASGLIRHEHQRGFFAPAWGPDGAVYYIERESSGLLFGIDWQLLDSPSMTWVLNDRVSIKRLDPISGDSRSLRSWEDTPVAGRVIVTPRSSAFGILLATLSTAGGLNFTVNISVPDHGTDRGNDLQQQQQQKLFTGRADNVLNRMRELMAVPGVHFYPAAIVTTVDNRDYQILLQNAEFDGLYPEGIPPSLLADLSRREAVARQQRIIEKRNALIAGYEREGLEHAEAVKRADRDLAAEGYQVLEPRLIAIRIQQPEQGERVFRIDPAAFEAGHFSDIRAAIEQPGFPVTKNEQPYQAESPVAAALNEWLAGGATSWVIGTESGFYRLQVRY